jgi:hypothetical protein
MAVVGPTASSVILVVVVVIPRVVVAVPPAEPNEIRHCLTDIF